MKRFLTHCVLAAALLLGGASASFAQSITTAAVGGVITGADNAPLAGATVTAVHVPSGTTYQGVTRSDGRFTMQGMRVGGPYRITVSFLGYENAVRENITLNLGVATDLNINMRQTAVQIEGLTVTAEQNTIMSSDRTGAATAVTREAIATLPTISRRIEDFARLTPQYSGSGFGFSFAGMDNRLNNVTVDGSYFNNSFGLSGQPGDRTGVAPISMDAIEQIQVNIAPFEVRQGNFVGAGVNTVTRSGTNEFRGSLYTQYRNESLVGTSAGDLDYDPGTFKYNQIGGWLSGPIIQNKLFFFASLEKDGLTEPGTNFVANTGGQPVEGNTTRVLKSDLDALSSFLKDNFGYDTGPYQGYDSETPALRFLAKVDYNLNTRNKLSLRYTHLDSDTDVLASNSSSLGFGTRRSVTTGLNFQNSNYKILENIRSVVGEWNSVIGANKSNNLILGYTYQDESRDSRGEFFPLVDIVEGGSTYTTFGFEPFTPSNQLRYSSFQLQDNFTIQLTKHAVTLGASLERYESENVFFPGSQSVYVYNSLADFYTDANGYLNNPNRTTSPVTLNRFQYRYSNIPGQDEPVQPLEVLYAGIYAQDEWTPNDKLKITLGLRMDVPTFGDTGFENPLANAMTFRDADGNAVQYRTEKLPDANLLFSPRLGFNLDVRGDRSTQVRGGTGIFTGRPAYVWISNQIGENGVLTGFEDVRGAAAINRPFNPDPHAYRPATVSGAPAASYALAFTDPGFKFPQVWRNNIAVDQRLPYGVIGTAEFLYSKDVNGVSYINANLPAAQSAFGGADTRPRWTNNRINGNVPNAIVLQNQAEGYSWNVAGSLEKPFASGLYVKGAYSYGEAKNTVDPGSIASGSWQNNAHAGDPNNPGLGFSATSPGHRVFAALSYRKDFFSFGATSLSLFWEGRTIGNASYLYANDLNGDGGTNDLIYIPRDVSEMNFAQYTQNASGGRPARTFTAAEQAAAWDAYINQDDYLSERRGQYAERNGVRLPMQFRADLGISQDLNAMFGGVTNGLQIRADILNFSNLLNSDWGISQRMVSTQPLTNAGADAQGRTTYRLRNISRPDAFELIDSTFEPTATIGDVWRMQLSLRYTFN
ncbi:MAG TPA: carboxypeptidase regulatory-like domain-containing protein [Longimicrobiales bacterium]|nr:carboxypeptidase regulatory-like domain-containing protein [Longimicrobiales bacterium]